MENVLGRLGTTDSTTLALKREDGGKIRITSLLSGAEVPEVRNVDGVLRVTEAPAPRNASLTDARCAVDVPRSFAVYVRSKVAIKI